MNKNTPLPIDFDTIGFSSKIRRKEQKPMWLFGARTVTLYKWLVFVYNAPKPGLYPHEKHWGYGKTLEEARTERDMFVRAFPAEYLEN
jgi:hypothetical protein